MFTVLKNHWTTALSVLAVAFLLLLSVASFAASDPAYTAEDRATGAVTGAAALALMAGLWGLRTGRLKLWAAHVLIVPPLVVVAGFFWMFLLPTILAFIIIFFGVIRGGLVRELRPSPSAPRAAI